MKGDGESANRNKDDVPSLPAQIPVGWQRKVEDGIVTYLSPSGAVLCSVEEAATYLLTEGTCKCGLECPVVLHKVFNFDPAVLVQQQRQQMGKIEGDMTKLCNHRRKVFAMATLCQNMHTSLLPPCHHTVDGLSRSHPSEELALIHVPENMEASTVHNGSLPFQDLNSHIIGVLGQLSTSTSVSLVENTSVVRLSESSHQNSNDAGPFLSVSVQSFTEMKLPDTGQGPTSPSVPTESISVIPHLTLDEHLLPASPGSPHFLGPLPVDLGSGGQYTQLPALPTVQGNAMASLLGPENLPVNCLSLLNPLSASGEGGEVCEKPGLQALFLASLLLSQQQATPLLFPDLLLQQQLPNLEDELILEKVPEPLDSLLSSLGFLEALEGLCLPIEKVLNSMSLMAEGAVQVLQGVCPLSDSTLQALQTVVFPSSFVPAGPALLPSAPAVSQAQNQVTFSPVPEITEDTTDKNNSPAPRFLPCPLASGVLGNLTALSTVNNFDSVLGSGPLLLSPIPTTVLELPAISGSALSVSLLEARAAEINPATCIINNVQLSAIPSSAMEAEKPISSLEPLSVASQRDVSTNNLSQEAVENPNCDLGPMQHQMEAKGGSFNPYTSFMDTIYKSFLQVSNKNTEGGATQATPSPLSSQPTAPMSLSPLRIFSLGNADLSQLSMEAAQSPAPGKPRPSKVYPSHLSQSSKPEVSEGHHEHPLPPTFLEEAKTDCSSIYSTALTFDLGAGNLQEEVNVTREGIIQCKRTGLQMTGGRRGRKRRQTDVRLQREPTDSRDIANEITDHYRPMVVQQKPERIIKRKRKSLRFAALVTQPV